MLTREPPWGQRMIAEKLSKTVVERIATVEQDIIVWDNTLPGFGIRVKPSGVRSYMSNIATGPPAHRSA